MTNSSRREFLKSGAALAGAALALSEVPFVHAGGDDLLRVGLIGCGGRGSGAAKQALKADKNVKLVAMGDAFSDKITSSLESIVKEKDIADKIDVPESRRFAGFDAYDKVIAQSDVVLLATPPHFRPLHLKAAVDAGKHVFAEKPVAVDAPGVRSVMTSCETAARKGLSVVSGLCLRYSDNFREMMKRIHEGAIGDIVALQANDLREGLKVKRTREKDWTEMEWQMRNWYYYTWLSGDFNVEQHVHFLDVCAWALKNQYPIRVVGTGGRQARTGEGYGHIYDHFAVTYEYASGVKLFSTCRQQERCDKDMSAYAMGTKGRAVINESKMQIIGPDAWEKSGKEDNEFYQQEHNELFASIRNSKPINNGDYMAKSTLMAIMARMAAYTGKTITWEQALNSREDLTPPRYDWDVQVAATTVAVPGVTEFK
jgi:predicted dehydrogenase